MKRKHSLQLFFSLHTREMVSALFSVWSQKLLQINMSSFLITFMSFLEEIPTLQLWCPIVLILTALNTKTILSLGSAFFSFSGIYLGDQLQTLLWNHTCVLGRHSSPKKKKNRPSLKKNTSINLRVFGTQHSPKNSGLCVWTVTLLKGWEKPGWCWRGDKDSLIQRDHVN